MRDSTRVGVPALPSAAAGFPPVARVDAGCLVLGSLPGRRSLEAGEYYAHPRNAFWRIMGEVAGAGPELPYPGRLERLVEARIALWDVLASSERPGSLDAAIRRDSAVPNDFAAFLGAHARIQCICFNGQAAASLFSRLVANEAGVPLSGIRLVTLPSTSPAHAALPFEAKLGHWADALRPVIRNHSSSPGAGHQ